MTERVDKNTDISAQSPMVDGRAAHEAAAAAEPGSDSRSDLDRLQDELEQARAEASASQDRYLRALAEQDNFKKRIERTYADLSTASKKDLLRKVLGVADNLERALQYGGSAESAEGIMEGVRLTQYQLENLLASEGVTPIEAAGKPFDPHTEEAIHSVNDPSVPDHTVVQVARKGYTYQDQVLRPAQVVVSVHGEPEGGNG